MNVDVLQRIISLTEVFDDNFALKQKLQLLHDNLAHRLDDFSAIIDTILDIELITAGSTREWEIYSLIIDVVLELVNFSPLRNQACEYLKRRLHDLLLHKECRIRQKCTEIIPKLLLEYKISFFREITEFLLQDILSNIDSRANCDRPVSLGTEKTVALDDTTGWNTLESSLQNLISIIENESAPTLIIFEQIIEEDVTDLRFVISGDEFTHLTIKTAYHINRYVRKLSFELISAIIKHISGGLRISSGYPTSKASQNMVLALSHGLQDYWSQVKSDMQLILIFYIYSYCIFNKFLCILNYQVRFAASLATRDFLLALKHDERESRLAWPILLPRICLNRLVLALKV